jgi:UDP-N-acetylglucosamine transferase subunit ALG13
LNHRADNHDAEPPIFVTVGTADKGIEFTRLIAAADEAAGRLALPMLIQRGTADYTPRHARCVDFLRFDEALAQFRDCRMVVGHCGAGTIIMALRFGKPLIVVPRRKGSGELDSDDHQMQLAGMLEGRRGVRVVYDVAELPEAIEQMLDAPPPAPPERSEEHARMLDAIRGFIEGR